MTQRTFIDLTAPEQYDGNPLAPVRGEASEPIVVGTVADQKKRASTQCDAIRARLREGSATNFGLAELSRKETCWISDLRKLGPDIKCVHRNKVTGLTFYRIKEAT